MKKNRATNHSFVFVLSLFTIFSPNSIELFARRLSESTAARANAMASTIFENRAVVAPPPPAPRPAQQGGSQTSLYENGENGTNEATGGTEKSSSAFTKFAPGNIFKSFFKYEYIKKKTKPFKPFCSSLNAKTHKKKI